MKLHELHPAAGATKGRTRVGRGIAAGKGKTAGRGTKGQKSRSGAQLPAWFEGGQTPIHMRVPKLRGFKRRGRIEYEVVNVGDIESAAERGRLTASEDGAEAPTTKRGRSRTEAALTVNAETLHGAGLVRDLRRPLKVLGEGELRRKLFVVADAFTKSARAKIEGAGGTAMTLEVPAAATTAVGVGTKPVRREPVTEPGRPGEADRATPAGEETPTDDATEEPATETTAVTETPAPAETSSTPETPASEIPGSEPPARSRRRSTRVEAAPEGGNAPADAES
jgi:large subunit ribosomal protein L15